MTKPVTVHFTPENDWSFTDDPVRMHKKDEVVYHRESGPPTWRFTGAVVTPNVPGLTIDVKENRVTIVDPCEANETLCVVLTVRHDNGTSYDSPDPQIINEPSKSFPSIWIAIGLVVGAIAGALIDMNTGSLESRGPLKGLIVGAIVGAIVGWLLARRKP